MINDATVLQVLVGISPDADFLHDEIGIAAKRLMKLEVTALAGVVPPDRSVRHRGFVS